MPTTEERLAELGFESIAQFQMFYGLAQTNTLDDATSAALNMPRFCNVVDRLNASQGKPRWGKRELTYAILSGLPGINLDQVKRAAEVAFDRWSAVCDIRASHIKTATEAADIVMEVAHIDGPSNVLAWSELPGMDTVRQLKQRYDSSDSWVIANNTTVGGKIDLIRVMCHELGHALGEAHLSVGNLLAPMYSQQINKPQTGDIAAMIERYGPPRVAPVPPHIPGPENEWVTIKIPRGWIIQ